MYTVSILFEQDRMQFYKLGEFKIINNMPWSFQISTDKVSMRLIEYIADENKNIAVRIQDESLSETHILMFTDNKYMRISWFDDPEEPNGSIDIGNRDLREDGLDFAHWVTLHGSVPKSVIRLVYLIVSGSEEANQYRYTPNFMKNSNNNSNPSPTPPPVKPNNTTKKKKKYKIRAIPKDI